MTRRCIGCADGAAGPAGAGAPAAGQRVVPHRRADVAGPAGRVGRADVRRRAGPRAPQVQRGARPARGTE